MRLKINLQYETHVQSQCDTWICNNYGCNWSEMLKTANFFLSFFFFFGNIDCSPLAIASLMALPFSSAPKMHNWVPQSTLTCSMSKRCLPALWPSRYQVIQPAAHASFRKPSGGGGCGRGKWAMVVMNRRSCCQIFPHAFTKYTSLLQQLFLELIITVFLLEGDCMKLYELS